MADTFYKIRNTETGNFKHKYSHGWNKTGTVYSTIGNARGAFSLIIQKDPQLEHKLEIVELVAFEVKSLPWWSAMPPTIPKEKLDWDDFKDDDTRRNFDMLMYVILEDLIERDCDNDNPVQLSIVHRVIEQTLHFEALKHNHDRDIEIMKNNTRTAAFNLSLAQDDMDRVIKRLTDPRLGYDIVRKYNNDR